MTESFLGITAHYLSADWHNRVVTLAVRTFPSLHTAERIRALLERVLKEWKIEFGQVFLFITDNGSNMAAAFKEVKMDILEEEEEETIFDAVVELDENDGSQFLIGKCCQYDGDVRLKRDHREPLCRKETYLVCKVASIVPVISVLWTSLLTFCFQTLYFLPR